MYKAKVWQMHISFWIPDHKYYEMYKGMYPPIECDVIIASNYKNPSSSISLNIKQYCTIVDWTIFATTNT